MTWESTKAKTSTWQVHSWVWQPSRLLESRVGLRQLILQPPDEGRGRGWNWHLWQLRPDLVASVRGTDSLGGQVCAGVSVLEVWSVFSQSLSSLYLITSLFGLIWCLSQFGLLSQKTTLLKPTDIDLSQFSRLEVQDRGTSMARFWWVSSSSWSHIVQGTRELSWVSFRKASVSFMRAPPRDLGTPKGTAF